jgi:hypothetical protein
MFYLLEYGHYAHLCSLSGEDHSKDSVGAKRALSGIIRAKGQVFQHLTRTWEVRVSQYTVRVPQKETSTEQEVRAIF